MKQPTSGLQPVGEHTGATLDQLKQFGKQYLEANKEIAMKNEESMSKEDESLWAVLEPVLRSPTAGRDAADLAYLCLLEDPALKGAGTMTEFIKRIAALLKRQDWQANEGYALTPQEYDASDRGAKVEQEAETVGLSLADALRRPPMSAARSKQIADDLVRGPCGRPSPAAPPEVVALSMQTPVPLSETRRKQVVAEMLRGHFPGGAA